VPEPPSPVVVRRLNQPIARDEGEVIAIALLCWVLAWPEHDGRHPAALTDAARRSMPEEAR
jgi:hypothetical protein